MHRRAHPASDCPSACSRTAASRRSRQTRNLTTSAVAERRPRAGCPIRSQHARHASSCWDCLASRVSAERFHCHHRNPAKPARDGVLPFIRHRRLVARTLIFRCRYVHRNAPQELAPFRAGWARWLPRRLRAYPSTGLDEFRRVYVPRMREVKSLFRLQLVSPVSMPRKALHQL